jgi:hypothetical protein
MTEENIAIEINVVYQTAIKFPSNNPVYFSPLSNIIKNSIYSTNGNTQD